MNSISGAASGWGAQLHRALMPDYNRQAATYWWAMVALGTAVLMYVLCWLGTLPPRDLIRVLAGVAVAALAGVFPVRMPGSKTSFAAAEVFIFLLLLMYGAPAAALAAAGEGLTASWRTSRRWTSRIATPAMAAATMLAVGSLLDSIRSAMHAAGISSATLLVCATVASALGYFLANTFLVTLLPRLKRNEWLTAADLFGHFGWIGIAHAGSASLATLLFLIVEQAGIGVLVAAVPIIALLLATVQLFLRQQEAGEAMRRARLEAIEREQHQSQRHMAELQASESRFHSAFTHASIGMALVGRDGAILQANGALRLLLGHSDANLCGRSFSASVLPNDVPVLDRQLAQAGDDQGGDAGASELRCLHADGHEVWVALHSSRFSGPEVAEPLMILQVQDITARRLAEQRLNEIAFNDSLTGLPNRRRFNDLLAQAVERARSDQQQFGVMFLDFDRFKLINDSLGHAAGDDFLVHIAQRIRANVRPTDVVARLGGDEFALLVEGTDCEAYAVSLAGRLLRVLAEPLQLAGTQINASASIGITSSAFDYTDPGGVLRDADIAMYRAKAAGKARYALFDLGLRAEVAGRLRLEGDLRLALDKDRLELAYQPLVHLQTGELVGFEALARWRHPELGDIPPPTFVAIAEEAGLAVQLSDFVMSTACRQLARWCQRDAAFASLSMQVNVSGNDIVHQGFVGRVVQAVVEAGLRPQHLTVELNESILMARLEAARPMLEALRSLGVQLAVDDFGTGCTSLCHLSSLPIDSLKIDKSFVHNLHRGADCAVVHAIVSLAQALQKSIYAEGIETVSQLDTLRGIECDVGQGFHLSPPMSAQEVDALLGCIQGSGSPGSALVILRQDQERRRRQRGAACVGDADPAEVAQLG